MEKVTHNIAITISIGFPVSAAVSACADTNSGVCGGLPYNGVPGELCRHRQLSGRRWQKGLYYWIVLTRHQNNCYLLLFGLAPCIISILPYHPSWSDTHTNKLLLILIPIILIFTGCRYLLPGGQPSPS